MNSTLDERLSNLELGRTFVAPIADALSKTFLLRKSSGAIPAFVVTFKGNKYLISHSALDNATEIRIGSSFFPLSPTYATYLGKNDTYRISVYKVTSNALAAFPWFDEKLYEGQDIFAIGPHAMGLSYETLSFGVADGVVSKVKRDLTTQLGDEYIQHTAEMFYSLYGALIPHTFGPLFTIKNNQPYLAGLNTTFDYIDSNDPTYIGITFAQSRSNIEAAIQSIIGG